LHDPTFPDILKSALTKFKQSSVHSSGRYNINSDLFKSPTTFKRVHQSVRNFPESFTVYRSTKKDFSSLSLLSLITDFDKNRFHPFHVEVRYGSQDLTIFCFLQNEMSASYAIYLTSDGSTLKITIQQLVALIKQQQIASFLFIPCAHDILLDFFASEHTLPRIARGSIDPLTVLKTRIH
jgi:hypothetical protein